MSPSPSWFKTRRRLSGLAFLLVMALLVWLSIALYQKKFTTAATVTLYTSSVGNEMHPGAEVIVRGVQVGEVRQISADGHGARLELAIDPGQLPNLPANVSAEMVPTTLFGERYVDLILPTRPTQARLTSGSIIRQDRSADAIEIGKVLNNLLPMLAATEPQKLSLTLTAIAQGLSGNGRTLGQSLVTLNSYLKQLNPELPQIDADIAKLGALARTYNQASPAILQALDDFGVTGRTLEQQRANFHALLTNITTASNDLTSFLNANSVNAIRLSADSVATLHILDRYSPEFPCVLQQLARFVPNMNKVLGKGTKQPGLHVRVVVVPNPGKYVAKVDTPVYGDNLGPHCYSVPFHGVSLHDGAPPPSTGTGTASSRRAATSAALSNSGPAGLAGSPAAAELVRELDALSLGSSPTSVPPWASLLTAPIYSGTEVKLG